MEQAAARQRSDNPIAPAYIAPGDASNPSADRVTGNIDQSHTEVNNTVTVNITAPPGSDEQVVGRIVRDELGKVLQETRGGQKETE